MRGAKRRAGARRASCGWGGAVLGGCWVEAARRSGAGRLGGARRRVNGTVKCQLGREITLRGPLRNCRSVHSAINRAVNCEVRHEVCRGVDREGSRQTDRGVCRELDRAVNRTVLCEVRRDVYGDGDVAYPTKLRRFGRNRRPVGRARGRCGRKWAWFGVWPERVSLLRIAEGIAKGIDRCGWRLRSADRLLGVIGCAWPTGGPAVRVAGLRRGGAGEDGMGLREFSGRMLVAG
jgi:hypothetical protein